MFCPNCGIDERQPNQFCRACGANLRPVLDAVSRPDSVTSAAVTAREEIGRAMAEKIREISSAKELKRIAEDVLPEMEKFLESPEEKRLRRYRGGTVTAFVGLGVALGFTLVTVAAKDEGFLMIASLGAVTFFIGLAIIINGFLWTVGRKKVTDGTGSAESQRILDTSTADLLPPTREPGESMRSFRSVTENTTKHLDSK